MFRKLMLLPPAALVLYRMAAKGHTTNIDGEQAIYDMRKIPINDTKLAVMIRGKDRRNPVLLCVTGGPCGTDIPIIKNIPIIGEIFSGHNIMVYLAFLCVPIVYVLIMRTTMGLRIRAVGENPDAAESVGVNVKKVQFQALALSGFFAGLGGITMSMAYLAFFSRGMTAGRGFISMSAMNLGNATPVGTALAALLFGMFDAMGNVLQTLSFPSQFIQMIPYAATLVGLVVFAIQTERRLKKIKMEEENQ